MTTSLEAKKGIEDLREVLSEGGRRGTERTSRRLREKILVEGERVAAHVSEVGVAAFMV